MPAPERTFSRNVPDAGLLNQRILIQEPDVAPDELGQTNRNWMDVATVWAQIIETPGREFLKGDYRPEEKVVMVIRYRVIDSTARAVWNGRTYRIESVTGTIRDGYRWLHCTTTEGAN